MLHIKKFIDKVSLMEGKQSKNFVMTIQDASGLRDELATILVDLYRVTKITEREEQIVKTVIKGGTFKNK